MSEHVLERLSAYLDGELQQDDQAAVREHLAGCPACAGSLAELAALDAFARTVPPPEPANYFETLPGRVRARLEAQRRTPRLPIWSLAVAAGLVLAVLTPAVLRRDLPEAAPEPKLPAAAPAAPSVDSFEQKLRQEKEDGSKRGGLLPPAAPPATWAMPPPAARVQPSPDATAPERSNRLKKEAAPPDADASGLMLATPPPAARAPDASAPVLEADQVRRQDAPAAQPRVATRDRQAAPKPAADESEGRVAAAGAVAVKTPASPSAADARFAWLLAGGRLEDADAARAVRDAWHAFVRDYPSHAGADEARVRALEAGAEAYRLSGDARDLESLRADAAAYLARADAAQPGRVRALLRKLEE